MNFLQQTSFLCLPFVVLQNKEEGGCDDWEYNGPQSITPSPVIRIESLGGLGSGKGGDDVGRGGESVCKASITQGGSVNGQNVDTKDDTSEPDSDKDLARTMINEKID